MATEVWHSRESDYRVPTDAEETWLGDPKGAQRQYRAGNMHIREYEDGFSVHRDMVDPRRDLLGHLIYDAPEVLAAAVGALVGGAATAYLNRNGSRGKIAEAGIAGSIVAGGLGYYILQWFKGD